MTASPLIGYRTMKFLVVKVKSLFNQVLSLSPADYKVKSTVGHASHLILSPAQELFMFCRYYQIQS